MSSALKIDGGDFRNVYIDMRSDGAIEVAQGSHSIVLAPREARELAFQLTWAADEIDAIGDKPT